MKKTDREILEEIMDVHKPAKMIAHSVLPSVMKHYKDMNENLKWQRLELIDDIEIMSKETSELRKERNDLKQKLDDLIDNLKKKKILEQIQSEIKESNRNINPIKKHHATTTGMWIGISYCLTNEQCKEIHENIAKRENIEMGNYGWTLRRSYGT